MIGWFGCRTSSTGLRGVDSSSGDPPASVSSDTGVPGIPDRDGDAAEEGPSTSPDYDLCQRSCEVVVAIPCDDRRPDCVEVCQQRLSVNPCAAQARALLRCSIDVGPVAFYCANPPGSTALMPGFCEAELAAGRACRSADASQ
jgi:hypothetical protein